jgi:hypothetical protein
MRNSQLVLELDAAAPVLRVVADSLKTEEKTVSRRRRRSRGGTESLRPSRSVADSPTSAPTRCVSAASDVCRCTDEKALLRKEVIQPHLPVRLPCYDFTPITDPTFDGSLSCELGHRLRVLPTFVV